ncbi:rhodanese-like domain-containing protein [Actinomadura logoneensis]|uniref:Rhodanese-like domain-containing protein n=1 Tax=Actinomadura logoneensis TaxID=2293572 RepID=A0A372JR56_9ACTN|nr:rhodanese-like domain-containing protein [Actinomadura logoneensis]RFU42525.1 rhodanese-like domain-containing protein [Actinomadura logoneensis]
MTALITRDELKRAVDAGTVTIVDALGGEYWAKQHLPGAVPLAPGEVDAEAAGRLPDRGAAIVTYCSNEACPNSGQVADRLTALGYTNVRKYKEGIEDWTGAGLPTESA